MKSFNEVCLDIETYQDVPPGLLEHAKKEWKHPKGWKDEEKIASWYERKSQSFLDDAAKNPRTGRVVAVGIGMRVHDPNNDTRGQWEHEVLVDRGGNEMLLLQTLDEVMSGARAARIITFNGRLFDLPFLASRAMRHRLDLSFRWPLGYHQMHIDMWEKLGKGKDGSLKSWCAAILGREPSGSGADVHTMVVDERWDDLVSYCDDDVRATTELYDALSATAIF